MLQTLRRSSHLAQAMRRTVSNTEQECCVPCCARCNGTSLTPMNAITCITHPYCHLREGRMHISACHMRITATITSQAIACEQNNFSCEFVTLRWDAMMAVRWCVHGARCNVSSGRTGNNNSPITPFAAPIIGHTWSFGGTSLLPASTNASALPASTGALALPASTGALALPASTGALALPASTGASALPSVYFDVCRADTKPISRSRCPAVDVDDMDTTNTNRTQVVALIPCACTTRALQDASGQCTALLANELFVAALTAPSGHRTERLRFGFQEYTELLLTRPHMHTRALRACCACSGCRG